MCVIAICQPSARPSLEQVSAMWEANPHGAGIAWTLRDGSGVQFVKGLMSLKAFEKAYKKVPKKATAVLHFRISTVGGVVRELTHPFIVSEESPLEMSGTASGVWFHNGHWHEWESALLQSTIATPKGQVPSGPLSDSRAMAVLAARHSERIGKLIPSSQRTVYLSAEGVVWNGAGWSTVKVGGGEIEVSNRNWDFVPRQASRSRYEPAWVTKYRTRETEVEVELEDDDDDDARYVDNDSQYDPTAGEIAAGIEWEQPIDFAALPEVTTGLGDVVDVQRSLFLSPEFDAAQKQLGKKGAE